MTTTVQQVLESFEALPEDGKHQAVVEILRQYAGAIAPISSPMPTPEEWQRRILETAGKWQGEFERPDPGEYERREPLS